MVRHPIDYSADAIEAARQVMLEIARVLGEYQDSIVVVGGWVPELLLTAAGVKHIGSNDVDIALNHSKISETGYRTIREHLLKRGYSQHLDQPFVFLRTVEINGQNITVHVDLLSGEYGGNTKKNVGTSVFRTYCPVRLGGAIWHSIITLKLSWKVSYPAALVTRL